MSMFPAGWKVEPLHQVCSEIVDCLNKTATVVDGPTPYKMIRTTNVKGGRVNLEDTRYVDEAVYRKWTRRFKPRRDDVILTREAPLGEVGLLRSDEHVFLGQRTMAYRANPTKLDQRFLYYSLIGPTLQAQIRMYGAGSTVEHMRVPQAESLQIPFPDLASQQKIAAILSAYDDLIANNQRRITLLERMAEDIYREWFVRLRFPGHEQVKIEKGVPQGWTLVKTEKAFKFYGGATPARDTARFWQNGDVNWFTPTDITGAEGMFLAASGEKCTEEGLRNCSSTLFPPYAVMMTSRATIGAIGINLTPACTNQGFITGIPNEAYPLAYLYHWLKLGKPHFESLSGGSTFAELTKGTFKRMEILTPPQPLVEKFQTLVAPLLKAIETHLKANASLKSTRDALLPRLISGKLAVAALDIRFPSKLPVQLDEKPVMQYPHA